jgi:hypothetical protein
MTVQNDTAPPAVDLVRALDEVLHGDTWARPYSPQEVWDQMLAEVRALVLLRSDVGQLLARHRWGQRP